MLAEHSYKQSLIIGYSRLSDLIRNENLSFQQERSLYLQNCMFRFIIPSININSNFKVSIGIEEYYKQIKNFTQCIFILKNTDIDKQPSKTEPITVWEIFQLLFSLEYNQVIMVFEKEEDHNSFRQKYNHVSSKYKEILLKQPQLDIIYKQTLTFNDLISISSKLRFPFIPKIIDPDTIFYITMLTKQNDWIEIKLCNGNIYVGQVLFIGTVQYEIQRVAINQQQINIMVAPTILTIKVKKCDQNQPHEIIEGMIGSRNLAKYVNQIKFTVYSIKSIQKEIEQKAISILKIQTSIKELVGKKNIQLDQHQKNKFILSQDNIQISFNQFNKLFFFSSLQRQLQYIGIIESENQNQIPCEQILLIPKQNFITKLQPGKKLENKKTFYFFCRLCEESPADSVLIPCGHFRYCMNCSQILNECYYCDQKIEKVIQITTMNLSHKQYYQIKNSTVTNWQLKSKDYQMIPVQFIIENEIISKIDKKINKNYKCQLCNQAVITHILYCSCNTKYVCEYCHIEKCGKCRNSKLHKINYDFID